MIVEAAPCHEEADLRSGPDRRHRPCPRPGRDGNSCGNALVGPSRGHSTDRKSTAPGTPAESSRLTSCDRSWPNRSVSTPPARSRSGMDSSEPGPSLARPSRTGLDAERRRGKTWNLGEEVSNGPVVVVFYLGSTCMACVTHLVELDVAMSRFDKRGDGCWPSAATHPSSRWNASANSAGFRSRS